MAVDGGKDKRTDLHSSFFDHGAVDLVDSTTDLLHVIRVGDDLIVGEDVLRWLY